eukprot:TRINITY_DN33660_c0_g1_i1.p1 TRINITY_DN33660_c0_g1~~TRINITY_DN33660_c0_g1_i1.p1  ORF type:complete len:1174 (+),score=181.68 TRINITY_DN33660_c0_g1_i1:52-3573(+)
MKVTVHLASLVFLMGLIIASAMVSVMYVGWRSAEEGIDDVADSLASTITQAAVIEIEEFMEAPFRTLERTISMMDDNLFSVDRLDAYELAKTPLSLGCTYWLSERCTDISAVSGMYIGNTHGHFCSALCGTEEVTTMPPIDQIQEGIPTWSIPCRYSPSCNSSYGCAELDDPQLKTCFGYKEIVSYPCRPHWYEESDYYSKDSAPACRSDATSALATCMDPPCPEFNRTYYVRSTGLYLRTRNDYDPRNRIWFQETSRLPSGSKYYTNLYICFTSGQPCLTAAMPIYSGVPLEGSIVAFDETVLEASQRPVRSSASRHKKLRGEVLGYSVQASDTHSLVVKYSNSTPPVVLNRRHVALACNTCLDEDTNFISHDRVRRLISTGVQLEKEVFVGSAIADYESWSLRQQLNRITVGKTGGLFLVERTIDATLIGSSLGVFKASNQTYSAWDTTKSPEQVTGVLHAIVGGDTRERILDLGNSSQYDISVNGADMWVSVVSIRPSDIHNLDWLLFVAIPQDDYLSTVQERRNNTIAISLSLCAFALILLLLFTYFFFVRPIAGITSDFELACSMELEHILEKRNKERQCTSFVKEVHHLTQSFDKMVSILAEYRSFIPAAILKDVQRNDEDLIVAKVSPPTGKVAIVFTDIEGSTPLWEAHPKAMKKSLAIHNQLFRRAIAKFSGYEIKTIGDAFMVAFESPVDAVNFGLWSQMELLQQDWPVDLLEEPKCEERTSGGSLIWNGLRVRIGIHYGPTTMSINPILGRADYSGSVVNMAARIESIACGGLVLCSKEVQDVIAITGLDSECTKIRYGKQPLKGFPEPHEVIGLIPNMLIGRKPEMILQLTRKKDTPPGVDKDRIGCYSNPLVGRTCENNIEVHQGQHPSETLGVLLPRLEISAGAVASTEMYYRGVDTLANEIVASQMGAFLSACETALHQSSGSLITSIGSILLVSWGTFKPTKGNHIMSIVRYATLLSADTEWITSSVGAVCGCLYYGRVIGINRSLATIVGPAVSIAISLSSAALERDKFCFIGTLPDFEVPIPPELYPYVRYYCKVPTACATGLPVFSVRVKRGFAERGLWNYFNEEEEEEKVHVPCDSVSLGSAATADAPPVLRMIDLATGKEKEDPKGPPSLGNHHKTIESTKLTTLSTTIGAPTVASRSIADKTQSVSFSLPG